VLTHPDGEAQLAISRWHFELRRTRRGHLLRRVSSQLIEIDGKVIEPGEEAPVRPGTTVRLAQVMTLRFLGNEQGHSVRDAVTLQRASDPRMETITLHEAASSLDDIDEAGSAEPPRVPVA
jgi:hypothetical protein